MGRGQDVGRDAFPMRHGLLQKRDLLFLLANPCQLFLGAWRFRMNQEGLDGVFRFGHRLVDTHSLAAGLRDAGRLPVADLSSTALFAHFGIEVPEEKRHTALGDALATFDLYWKLVELAR